jgi:nitrite reductase/ring-hydroxylating ferredoxin subunit
MRKSILWISALLVAMSVLGLACGSESKGDITNENDGAGNISPAGKVSPTWIDVVIEGDAVSIPTSELAAGKQIHFTLASDLGDRHFMAYQLEGRTHVRANVCPPCRSIGFSRDGDELVCDRCGTIFDATTGDGISGACRDYPKAGVDSTVSDDQTVVSHSALMTAYNDTLQRG